MAKKTKTSRSRSSHKSKTKLTKSKPARTTRRVYYFGDGKADGAGHMKPLLGGKGANLAEMTRIGLPVPPGFTITTEVCTYFSENKRSYPRGLEAEVEAALAKVEKSVGKKLGDKERPLLVSVRSGARDSMPGMMDTILNLGMNDTVVLIVARQTSNPRFAWDSYRRFLQMYGDVVMGVQKRAGEDHEPFESAIEHLKDERYGNHHLPDVELTVDDLIELVRRFKALIKERTGKSFPQDARAQLWGSIGAVFGSWNNDRAIVYRRKYGIPHDGARRSTCRRWSSATWATRARPASPSRAIRPAARKFLRRISHQRPGRRRGRGRAHAAPDRQARRRNAAAHTAAHESARSARKHFKDMQDLEFTVEDNRLTSANAQRQTHRARRGPHRGRDGGGTIDHQGSRDQTHPRRFVSPLLAPIFDRASIAAAKKIGSGLPAGPGAACGHVVFSAEEAVRRAERGDKVLLARIETSPEDLRGMIAAEGILTSRGGVSSHAALVARQMGKVCVCGAAEIAIDYQNRTMSAGGVTLREGDHLSIDGTAGEVFAGEVTTAPSEIVQVLVNRSLNGKKSAIYQQYAQLMSWVDRARKLNVRTNADSPDQVKNAIAFGAEGIGLCRTEHMFFEGDRIDAMREMILAEDKAARVKALAKLLPYQRQDFAGIFQALDGLPATIRFLDPPLHEFLPHDRDQQVDLAGKLGVPVEGIRRRVHELHEFNPMLGHRGCRLGISFPEISEMQARAVFEAAAEVQKKGKKVRPEIMIPLVGFPRELQLQIEIVHRVAAEVAKEKKTKFNYLVGTMIEIPRAALVADEIAKDAEFFSFGTNDLTQTTLGMSRDDSGSFLPHYAELDIVPNNPFASIDQKGVGRLMEITRDLGRKARPKIKLGICGEHGGEPSSVKFCHRLGLDYVSCSPFRVPIAKLAAAQAALEL
jgi:pyruvate,orthophosphate dikinase